jgi:hypothetical protein
MVNSGEILPNDEGVFLIPDMWELGRINGEDDFGVGEALLRGLYSPPNHNPYGLSAKFHHIWQGVQWSPDSNPKCDKCDR